MHLTNQFSEFYHNVTDAKQGLRHYVNQPLHNIHVYVYTIIKGHHAHVHAYVNHDLPIL